MKLALMALERGDAVIGADTASVRDGVVTVGEFLFDGTGETRWTKFIVPETFEMEAVG